MPQPGAAVLFPRFPVSANHLYARPSSTDRVLRFIRPDSGSAKQEVDHVGAAPPTRPAHHEDLASRQAQGVPTVRVGAEFLLRCSGRAMHTGGPQAELLEAREIGFAGRPRGRWLTGIFASPRWCSRPICHSGRPGSSRRGQVRTESPRCLRAYTARD
jgi:hypothetical protein